MKQKPDKEAAAIRLLQEKAVGLGRLPKKQDFEPALVSRIKSSLGPWPRALEKAGLKPVRRRISTGTLGKKLSERESQEKSHPYIR